MSDSNDFGQGGSAPQDRPRTPHGWQGAHPMPPPTMQQLVLGITADPRIGDISIALEHLTRLAAEQVRLVFNIANHLAGLDAKFETLASGLAVLGEAVAATGLRIEETQATAGDIARRVADVPQFIRDVLTLERNTMVTLADLQAAATRLEQQTSENGDLVKQAVGSINTMHGELVDVRKQLAAALDNGSDEELQAVLDRIDTVLSQNDASKQSLLEAINAATDNPSNPAPTPVPEPTPTPTPEPVPVPVPEPTPEPTPVPEPVPEPVPVEPVPAEPTPTPPEGGIDTGTDPSEPGAEGGVDAANRG